MTDEGSPGIGFCGARSSDHGLCIGGPVPATVAAGVGRWVSVAVKCRPRDGLVGFEALVGASGTAWTLVKGRTDSAEGFPVEAATSPPTIGCSAVSVVVVGAGVAEGRAAADATC